VASKLPGLFRSLWPGAKAKPNEPSEPICPVVSAGGRYKPLENVGYDEGLQTRQALKTMILQLLATG
jgi:hypothetical protein